MMLLALLLSITGIITLPLLLLRSGDARAERREWQRLLQYQPASPAHYSPALVDGLPEPARRFFHFAIAPGTPLLTVAEIQMAGRFSLGSRDRPGFRRMQATQVLAAPHGFVWQLQLPGLLPISGSDSGRWTRFFIAGLVPVARLGGDPDHALAAYGRCIAEALLWTPAALLPGPGISWQAVDADTARVTVCHNGLSQAVDITVAADGQPLQVQFMRWTNANAEHRYRRQAFGGYLSDFREVQGYRLPFAVQAGNQFATSEWFAFYQAQIVSIRFPSLA